MAPTPLALVPAAASSLAASPAPKDPPVSTVVAKIVSDLEAAVGGRKALIGALLAGHLSDEVHAVVAFLGDPRYDRWTLAKICQRARISPAQLFDAFKKAHLAKAHVLATLKAAEEIPRITEEALAAARTHEEPCQSCNTVGTVTPPASKKTPDPQPETCRTCNGRGQIVVNGDLDHQRMAFELTGLIKKSGGGVAVQTNVHLPQTSSPLGGLEQLQQAIQSIVYGKELQEPEMDEEAADGEIVEPTGEDESAEEERAP